MPSTALHFNENKKLGLFVNDSIYCDYIHIVKIQVAENLLVVLSYKRLR